MLLQTRILLGKLWTLSIVENSSNSMKKAMAAKLRDLASLVSGRLEGDADYCVNALEPIDSAGNAAITFFSSANYDQLLSTNAGCVVLNEEAADRISGNRIVVPDPYYAYALLSKYFDSRGRVEGIHQSAVIAESALIGEGVRIGANCVVGENTSIGVGTEIYPGTVVGDDTTIGRDVLIHANVTLYHEITIGNDVVIHSGAVIGSDGFGFAPSKNGWKKIHQLGSVVIGDNVEIGASTAIDRGALGDTVISDGVIIDNQVHIAHNVEIGKNSAIAGCVGIAGSTVLGENCTVAGAVAINGHINIADNSHFHGGTIVTKGNQTGGQFASTTPQLDVKKWRRTSVRYTQLDDMASRIKQLEKQLADLN